MTGRLQNSSTTLLNIITNRAETIQRPMATMQTPASELPATVKSRGSPGPFTRAPREVRDQIYRFLLSTEYTQHVHSEIKGQGFTNSDDSSDAPTVKYKLSYRFHTSILLTNRQIHHEASHVFYMENLFIRVNTVILTPMRLPNVLGGWREYALPVFSNSTNIQACKRHVMDINMVPESQWPHPREQCTFILACRDLPMLGRTLLLMSTQTEYSFDFLLGTDLQIIIRDDIGIAGEGSVISISKNTMASSQGSPKDLTVDGDRNATICSRANGGGNTRTNGLMGNESSLSAPNLDHSPRVRRLLEPLRALHSIGTPCITAPISQRYKQEIETSLSRERPSFSELSLIVTSVYDDANKTFDAGDFASAIDKTNGALDLMYESLQQLIVRQMMEETPSGIPEFFETCLCMQYKLVKVLARANSKFPKDLTRIRTTQHLAHQVVKMRSPSALPVESGHEKAMDHYLEAEIWEALDQLGEHKGRPRSQALRDVIKMLKRALRHEPENSVWQQELMKRQKEKENAKTIEDVMEMEKAEGAVQSQPRSADGNLLERGEDRID